MRLYYIAFPSERLRQRIVANLCRIDSDDIKSFLTLHLQSNQNQQLSLESRFTDHCVNFMLTKYFDSFFTYILQQQNSLIVVSFLNFMKQNGVQIEQFKTPILENLTYLKQGEAEVIACFDFSMEETLMMIEKFCKRNCDCLVVKIIQICGAEELIEFFTGTVYEEIIKQEIRKRNWMIAEMY
ncbi:Conserved_hypothetical protein [Hexamita inflata]|uniref:Uncharacterized protein n=1 Tax=Hexamita inflata TaxID=28002 RepID=A0AA86RJX9_9EUKA|nr:Conserved hypothetical protein [Hexamita inflata]